MTQEPDAKNGVWVTPNEYFDPLQEEFQLEVDVAANPENAMLPRFFDEQMDAFKQDWTGIRAWCNPPYVRKEIYRWVKQCATGGAEIVVALLPARTDTKWFHDFIYNKPNVEIRFLKGRIRFSGSKSAGKVPSMVVIFRRNS